MSNSGAPSSFCPRIPKHSRTSRETLWGSRRQTGVIADPGKLHQRIQRKDTAHRFAKLQEERRHVFDAQPSLLSGHDFDECLAQYEALIAHVESLWAAACNLYLQENHPLATFLSILVIEEIGKLTNLFTDLLFFDVERPIPSTQSVDGNHKRKQLTGIFSGALVNARLDRVLGFDTVRKLLNIAQSNGLLRNYARTASISIFSMAARPRPESESIPSAQGSSRSSPAR